MTAPNAPMSAAEVLQQAINAYARLHDFLSDAIEGGRLTEADAPDDYQAFVLQLEECARFEHFARTAVAAMAEREAALVKEVEALAVRLKALESEVSARRAGWASFVDDEDPSLLVVAHQDRPVHFTGASAWDDANAIDAARAESGHD